MGIHLPAGVNLGGRAGVQLGRSTAIPDPLAGITFSLRLQTHLPGSNTPISLYQVNDGTVPATIAGDDVNSWSDELGTSGILAKAFSATPKLQFSGVVPVIRFVSASSQAMQAIMATVSQPNIVSFAAKVTSTPAQGRLTDNGTANRQIVSLTQAAGNLEIYAGNDLVDGVEHRGAFHTFTGVFNGATSSSYVDGVLATSGDAGTNGIQNPFIGTDGGNFLQGDIIAMFIYTDPSKRAVVDSYLASLLP